MPAQMFGPEGVDPDGTGPSSGGDAGPSGAEGAGPSSRAGDDEEGGSGVEAAGGEQGAAAGDEEGKAPTDRVEIWFIDVPPPLHPKVGASGSSCSPLVFLVLGPRPEGLQSSCLVWCPHRNLTWGLHAAGSQTLPQSQAPKDADAAGAAGPLTGKKRPGSAGSNAVRPREHFTSKGLPMLEGAVGRAHDSRAAYHAPKHLTHLTAINSMPTPLQPVGPLLQGDDEEEEEEEFREKQRSLQELRGHIEARTIQDIQASVCHRFNLLAGLITDCLLTLRHKVGLGHVPSLLVGHLLRAWGKACMSQCLKRKC